MSIFKSRTIAIASAAAIAALAVTGCNKGGGDVGTTAPAPKIEKFPENVKIADLLPSATGTQSTFKQAGGDSDTELTLRVAGSQDTANGKEVKIEVLEGTKVTDTVTWQVSDKGIYQLTARNGQKYSPPQLSVPGDIKDKKEHSYDGTGPYPTVETGAPVFGALKGKVVSRGIEVVDTDMGQIEAVAIVSAYTYKAGKFDYGVLNTTWFAPKYGIVRMVQQTQRSDQAGSSLTLKLTGFRSK